MRRFVSKRLEISIVSGREMGERRVGERKHVDRCFSLAIFIEPFYYVTRGYFVRATKTVPPSFHYCPLFDSRFPSTRQRLLYTYIYVYTRNGLEKYRG